MSNDKYIEEKLRQDDTSVLKEVYKLYKEEFENYSSQFPLDKDETLDVYQDSVIVMHQHFVLTQKKLYDKNLKSFLFGIGTHLLLKRLKQFDIDYKADSNHINYPIVEIDKEEISERQLIMASYLKELSSSCYDLLKMFYYHNMSIDQIAQSTNYKDAKDVISSKKRCLKRFSNLVKSKG